MNTVTGQSTANSQQMYTPSGFIEKIYWEVRDIRTLDDSHFSHAVDIAGLREQRPDGALAFLPFNQESSLTSTELHNALYRCVAVTQVGTIASRSTLVTLGMF